MLLSYYKGGLITENNVFVFSSPALVTQCCVRKPPATFQPLHTRKPSSTCNWQNRVQFRYSWTGLDRSQKGEVKSGMERCQVLCEQGVMYEEGKYNKDWYNFYVNILFYLFMFFFLWFRSEFITFTPLSQLCCHLYLLCCVLVLNASSEYFLNMMKLKKKPV